MSRDANETEAIGAAPLSASERAELLRLAHTAIGCSLGLAELPELLVRTANLLEPNGVFVTLHLGGDLRGCIGTLQAEAAALFESVIRTARAAAFEDPRFSPLTAVEWHQLDIEISRLSRPQRSTPAQVIAGVHGVHIARGPARALLLPQVGRLRGWNSERLLREVCRKAGLGEDAWRESETELTVFTAEVFGGGPPFGNPAERS